MKRWLRAFAIVLVLMLAAMAAFVTWAAPPSASESLVFVGGTILTMAEPSVVEALWVERGRVRATGAQEDVLRAAGPDADVFNLGGATLMPGLIEPHTHPIATAMLGSAIDVSGFTHDTPEQVRAALEKGVQGFTPQPWIVAFGWDPVMMPDLAPPTLEELDALSPDKPLVVLTQMMHVAYANSAALRDAGLSKDTPDPIGGHFGRNDDGTLNGVVYEVAALDQLVGAMPAVNDSITKLLLRWQYGAYAEAGYTTLGVLGPVGRAKDPIGMMRTLGNDTSVPVRTVVYALPGQLDAMREPDDPSEASMILRGVKFWMDGSPYTGGAAFEEPYENSELVLETLDLPMNHLAPLNYEAGAFTEEFERFHRAGYQVAVHTQGERAVERVLDAAEDVLARFPRGNHGHRLEHNALIREDQIDRAQELGMELGFFVDHIYYYGHQLPALVGDRTERYMPVGTAVRAGIAPTLHTDNPATPIGPFRAMQTAMRRTPRNGGQALGPDESLSAEEALQAMTTNAARQLGVGEDRGSLEVGKAADLVMLSRNPLDTPADGFTSIEVLGTWMDGQPVDTRKASLPNLRIAAGVVIGAEP
ncbi:MAG: amidohydrolase [Polyangiales bacterium]